MRPIRIATQGFMYVIYHKIRLLLGDLQYFFCPYEMYKEVGARPLKIAVGSKLMIYTTCFYTLSIYF